MTLVPKQVQVSVYASKQRAWVLSDPVCNFYPRVEKLMCGFRSTVTGRFG